MLHLAGFETIRSWQEVLWPLPLGGFFNKFLVRFWPFNEFALVNFLIARPQPSPDDDELTVSVIVPARNEAGNIKAIFERVPKMGRATELVFVEGHSQDDTYTTIEKEIAVHPSTPSLLLRQTGAGKADAVRLGFERASGEILMILDADLTVPPEDLPRFYEALISGKGEFINGVRLVYPMEEQAMRSLNFLGNKFFSLAFSWLLGQPIKDTLCGTKVLWKKDYQIIAANRSYFGDFDPFGDFDLLFGAAKQNLKIVDLPIRYRERTYGSTNISRWKHGLLLMRMVSFAARRIKFV
jgi:glycosyltransferase involved in cell wall biosynthesis